MKQTTLCLITNEKQILLGMKKKGFGSGRFNGFGGKQQPNETIEQATARELEEESGIALPLAALRKAGELTFIFPTKPDWDQVCHVFCAHHNGEVVESDEMKPKWFSQDSIPYEEMWPDDKHWLPLVLKGEFVTARFVFAEDQKTILEHYINSKLL